MSGRMEVELERKMVAALVIIRIHRIWFVIARTCYLASRHAVVLYRVIPALVYRFPAQGTQETQN